MINLHELLKTAPLPIILLEGNRVVYANEEAKKCGLDTAEILGKEKILIDKKIYKLLKNEINNFSLIFAFEYTEEQKNLETLQAYERFFKGGKDFFFILDEKGRFLDVNQAYEVIGYCKEELLGKNSREITFDDQIELKTNFLVFWHCVPSVNSTKTKSESFCSLEGT